MQNNLGNLSNQILVSSLKALVHKEREVLSEVIRYLQEVDLRKLYLELGYSSLFAFCTNALGYSEGAAQRRIQAARSSKETPELLTKIEDGTLSLCAVSELARVTPSVREDLIPLSIGKPKEEVKRLVAQYLPAREATKQIERVGVSRAKQPELQVLPLFEQKVEPGITPVAKSDPEPLRYTVTLDLSEEEYQLLQEVQRLSNSLKKSAAVVQALKLFQKLRSPAAREKHKEQRQQTSKEATVTVAVQSAFTRNRHVPIEIRDAVFIRDRGRCTFVSADGTRCNECRNIQLDHITPYSVGGTHKVENLRLLCGVHNRFVFEQGSHGYAASAVG